MAERKTRTIVKARFLGQEFSINLLSPLKTVRLPIHNILDDEGRDTGIQCPSRAGVVSISSLMDLDYSHEVIIRCESADKPFPAKDGWVQCRTATKTHIKR